MVTTGDARNGPRREAGQLSQLAGRNGAGAIQEIQTFAFIIFLQVRTSTRINGLSCHPATVWGG